MEENKTSILEKKEGKQELAAKAKLKSLKQTLTFIVIIVVLLVVGVAMIWMQNAKLDKLEVDNAEKDALIKELKENPVVVNPVSPEITLDIVNQEIKSIGELATMEYIYTNAGRFSDARHIKKWDVPFTEKSFVMKWDGVIKAGIEVDKVTTEIDKENKVLTVYLPQAEILSHAPDKDSAEVLDEKDGLFNLVTLNDQIKCEVAMEKEMEKRAIEKLRNFLS